MRWSRTSIIGLALALLVGCSAVRLGYNQASQLAYWWLDSHLDFNADQTPRVREALANWFAWHRQTQLADYAATLSRARAEAEADVSAAQVCRWNDQLRERLDPAIERVLPQAAEIALTLTPAQVNHLDKRLQVANEKFRKEHLQADPAERQETAGERLIERFESLYGRLDDGQRRQVAASAATSPYDADAWFTEREARQRDLVAALCGIVTSKPDAARVQAILRTLARRFDGSPLGPLQTARERLTQHYCVHVARFHNGTSSAQRQHLRKKLAGWEGDFRQLAAEALPAGAAVRLGSR